MTTLFNINHYLAIDKSIWSITQKENLQKNEKDEMHPGLASAESFAITITVNNVTLLQLKPKEVLNHYES